MFRRMATAAPFGLDFRRATFFKGARIVASYAASAALAWALARALGWQQPGNTVLLAANLSLWACVSEFGRSRFHGARLLFLMCLAGVLGAASFAVLGPMLMHAGRAAPEFALLVGAFLVGSLKRFGSAGAGVGSQFYIGQMLAWSMPVGPGDGGMLLVAGAAAALATVLCRVLLTEFGGGVAEPPPEPPSPDTPTALAMGLHACLGSLLLLGLDALVDLKEPAWAVTACVYVIAGTPDQTLSRGRQRMVGTLVGVAMGLAVLPLVYHLPWVAWASAALAMMLYTTALAARYDLACGAYAYTLMVTLAAQGEHSLAVLSARAWETLLGATVAMLLARFLPLRRAGRAASLRRGCG